MAADRRSIDFYVFAIALDALLTCYVIAGCCLPVREFVPIV